MMFQSGECVFLRLPLNIFLLSVTTPLNDYYEDIVVNR